MALPFYEITEPCPVKLSQGSHTPQSTCAWAPAGFLPHRQGHRQDAGMAGSKGLLWHLLATGLGLVGSHLYRCTRLREVASQKTQTSISKGGAGRGKKYFCKVSGMYLKCCMMGWRCGNKRVGRWQHQRMG